MPFINEAAYALMEGVAEAEAIDTIARLGFAHPLGPLALADLIGLDTCVAIMDVLHCGARRPEVRALSVAAPIRAGGASRPQYPGTASTTTPRSAATASTKTRRDTALAAVLGRMKLLDRAARAAPATARRARPPRSGSTSRGRREVRTGSTGWPKLVERLGGAAEPAVRRGDDARCCSCSREWMRSGKDGVIRSVFTGVNPQGCRVESFKVPTTDELAHDFLWRVHARCPARGEIGIFNRSHYEDVVAVRVREPRRRDGVVEALRAHRARSSDCSRTRAHRSVKVFLHQSRDEQRKRLQERVDDPEKRWKFRLGDLDDRAKLGRLPGAPTRTRSARRRPSTRPGTSCPPTTTGPETSVSPRSSSTLSSGSIRLCRPSSPARPA